MLRNDLQSQILTPLDLVLDLRMMLFPPLSLNYQRLDHHTNEIQE